MTEQAYMSGNEFVSKILNGERDFSNIKLEERFNLNNHEGFITLNDYLKSQTDISKNPIIIDNSDFSGITARELYLPHVLGDHTNLRGADLREANLREAYLGGANLRDANLEGVNLERANLRMANLRGVNLRDANLEEASLREADLREAYLVRVNLGWADLRGAYIRFASLEGVNLEGANLDDMLKKQIKMA